MSEKKEPRDKNTAFLFGKRLKRLREEMHIEQRDLAKVLGINKDVLNRYENGNRGFLPRIPTIRRLANFFGVSIDWLISPEDDTDKPLPVSPEHLQRIIVRTYNAMALRVAEIPEENIPEVIEEMEKIIQRFKKWAKKDGKREKKETDQS
ncbi:MAG: helix-turn-helix domain-containing protein [Desulfotomaculales bacterium]